MHGLPSIRPSSPLSCSASISANPEQRTSKPESATSSQQPDWNQYDISPAVIDADEIDAGERASAIEHGTNDTTPEVELTPPPIRQQDNPEDTANSEPDRSTDTTPDSSHATAPQKSPKGKSSSRSARSRPASSKSASSEADARTVAQFSAIVMAIAVIVFWLLLR